MYIAPINLAGYKNLNIENMKRNRTIKLSKRVYKLYFWIWLNDDFGILYLFILNKIALV